VSSVSPSGRYFLDQYGRPLLVKGDSPWALMTRLSPRQARRWFTDRHKQGFNAAIISLIGATANGAPGDDGATYDGLRPFVKGDIRRWQEPYWQRVTAYLRMAADNGITFMLLPIDGWAIGRSFVPRSIGQCQRYGGMLAERLRDLPNIVWMSGGDYYFTAKDPARGTDVDDCIDAMMRGIRQAGDARPFSMELKARKSLSTDNAYWARRVDWNFVYTYYPTYKGVLDAYRRQPAVPAVLGEANYQGENNQGETPPTTDETLRRQVLWSLSSGAAGEFVGSSDWDFHDSGWERRLSTRAVTQITRLRALFSALRWWQLVPDTAGELVTAGRGTRLTGDEPMDVLDNDYVTAARTPDRRLAVVYLPTQRTISVSPSAMAAGTQAAVDRSGLRLQPARLHVGNVHHAGQECRGRQRLAAAADLVDAARQSRRKVWIRRAAYLSIMTQSEQGRPGVRSRHVVGAVSSAAVGSACGRSRPGRPRCGGRRRRRWRGRGWPGSRARRGG
jgi:hypothetical protein